MPSESELAMQRAEKALSESEETYRLLFELSEDPMWLIVKDRFAIANQAAARVLGYETVEALTDTHPSKLSPEYQPDGQSSYEKANEMMAHAYRDGYHRFEWLHKKKNGELFSVEVSLTRIPYAGGVALYCVWRDISERKRIETEVLNYANYDQLTGLPNRRLFYDRLEQEVRKAKREQQVITLLFIDIDRFKEVNDTLGHDIGDQLLVEAASRIKRCVRDYDTVARLGGDEFTIILSELHDASDIERISQSIIDRLSEPFMLGERESYVSASIGIALYPDDATNLTDLIKHADQAMYKAKNDGRSCFRFFTKAMQETSDMRMQLARDLRIAIAAGQFEVYYQPIIELDTSHIHKAEALLRWKHPEHGFISPADFIPIAEDTGTIHDIGNWVFMQAALQVKKLIAGLGRDFQISINKSPVQFMGADREHNYWIENLDAMGLPGSSIAIEITEGLLMNNDASINDKLLMFSEAGIQVAIDDFGTGYSSLAYLMKYDIDYLKIDQSFTRNLVPDAPEFALCEAIVVMAHKLGLKVIAEGVETEQQRDLLRQISCDYGQGYLISRPVPAGEFEKLLAQG